MAYWSIRIIMIRRPQLKDHDQEEHEQQDNDDDELLRHDHRSTAPPVQTTRIMNGGSSNEIETTGNQEAYSHQEQYLQYHQPLNNPDDYHDYYRRQQQQQLLLPHDLTATTPSTNFHNSSSTPTCSPIGSHSSRNVIIKNNNHDNIISNFTTSLSFQNSNTQTASTSNLMVSSPILLSNSASSNIAKTAVAAAGGVQGEFSHGTNTTTTKIVFAPPPPFPTSLEVTKSKFSNYATTKSVKSTLPPYHEIKHSGHALARFSAKSRFLTKKWRPIFWITQAQHKMLFFRSKDDFDEWAANPYLTTEERIKLVKLTVDFKNDAYKPGYKHLKGYRASPIQSKFVKINQKNKQQEHNKQIGTYSNNIQEGTLRKMASHFALECWTSSKHPSILVEIGGTDAGQVGALHIILVEMIQLSGHAYTPPTPHRSSGGGGGSSRNDISTNDSHTSTSRRINRNRSNSSVWEMHSGGSRSSGGIGYYSGSNLSYASSVQSNDDSGYDSSQASHSSSLGSRIMMRMRSRSPSTRARRLQEMQQEMLRQEQEEVEEEYRY